ncbi:hypothetical protein F5884DRAFT_438967 [Xylogone sp. PMI_703]|nr:hypothetical protein F5884DRAFT_438967 [Xylogone sp. PMI_703]
MSSDVESLAESSERPAKRPRAKPDRVRQACEPCRRKKAKCDGERPNCSLCSRLRQPCFYDERRQHAPKHTSRSSIGSLDTRATSSNTEMRNGNTQRLEDRLRAVEAKLAEVAANQERSWTSPRPISHSPIPRDSAIEASADTASLCNKSIPLHGLPSNIERTLPPWEVIEEVAKKYLLYCDCQPLPLFSPNTLLQSLKNRKPEVLLSILALALRFIEGFDANTDIQHINNYAEDARRIVMKSVTDGEVELATLQTLCLLSLVDFSSGNTRRASVHCSLAMSLAYTAGLSSEIAISFPQADRAERGLCFWSLYLLKQLHGPNFCILEFPEEDNFPSYPESTGPPSRPSQVGEATPDDHPSRAGPSDEGILLYAIDMAVVWSKITAYARRRGKPSRLPPWAPESEYQVIMAQIMDAETKMPWIHRFKPAEFSKRTPEDLHINRRYWGPWLFTQFVYHTNLCLLNHPLLLSLRLRNLKCAIPEIFIQHTDDLIASHSSWMIHFLDMLEAKNFSVSDPFLAHCMAVVATICLQGSLTDDDENIREEKKTSFLKCLKFVRSIGQNWPHVDRIADKLQRLGETVSLSQPVQTPTRNLLIDLGQFWEILEYSTSTETFSRSGNLFVPSLYTSFQPNRNSYFTDMAQTSSLPRPSRVDGQDFATPTPPAAISRQNSSSNAVGEGGRAGSNQVSSVFETVLAENLFPQRLPEFATTEDGWWNSGNL